MVVQSYARSSQALNCSPTPVHTTYISVCIHKCGFPNYIVLISNLYIHMNVYVTGT